MSTLQVNTLVANQRQLNLDTSELGYRMIKRVRQLYTGGQWNPDTNFNWVPGMFFDYTPASTGTRVRITCHIPHAGLNAAHVISHWIFYSNGIEQGKHSISGNHYEDAGTYVWEVASWGTFNARVGYQMRSYANDNHETRVYTTRYWDGGGSNQNCYGQLQIEEFFRGL
jgi:hypothetical protein